MGSLLEHATGLFKGRLICHGPATSEHSPDQSTNRIAYVSVYCV